MTVCPLRSHQASKQGLLESWFSCYISTQVYYKRKGGEAHPIFRFSKETDFLGLKVRQISSFWIAWVDTSQEFLQLLIVTLILLSGLRWRGGKLYTFSCVVFSNRKGAREPLPYIKIPPTRETGTGGLRPNYFQSLKQFQTSCSSWPTVPLLCSFLAPTPSRTSRDSCTFIYLTYLHAAILSKGARTMHHSEQRCAIHFKKP